MEEKIMRNKIWRKIIAIIIISLFFAGAAQIGLSTSETKIGLILKTSQSESISTPLTGRMDV